MSDSTSGWFSGLFGGGAGSAAGFGNSATAWAEMGPGQYGPLSQGQIDTAAKGAGVNPNAGLFGLSDDQWGKVTTGLGTLAKGAAGTGTAAAGTGAAAGTAAAAPHGAGIHPGNPAGFQAMLQQEIARRQALMPQIGPPPGLLGAGRG
jgi:hypothetical protein